MTKSANAGPPPAAEMEMLPREPVNLGDTAHIKRVVDDAASQVILAHGYPEDFFVGNVKIGLGIITCSFALCAQFYPKKFPDNWWVLLICVVGYTTCNMALSAFAMFKEKDSVLITHAHEDGKKPGVMLCTRLARFEDMCTLRLCAREGTADAREEVLTKSVAGWFDEDGLLADEVLAADVEKMLKAYEGKEARKTK